ncbi:recombinase family protein [Streptomyces sp. NPDC014676]|uniref:recombinase family protein n=1 Tax=Streptomyces sp. NPDC014676 TaxID=3364879 RepID=UPI0036FC54D8
MTITRTGAEAGVRDGTTRAPCSALGQDDAQLDALRATASRGTRSSARRSAPASAEGPVRGGARTAREVKVHAPHCRVIFTVYEMKRLGRDAAELTALADHLTAHGPVLEMLAGPLPGIHGPTGPGKLLFAFFAAMAETERENIPESTLEGLDTAARKGKHGGRPPVKSSEPVNCTNASACPPARHPSTSPAAASDTSPAKASSLNPDEAATGSGLNVH